MSESDCVVMIQSADMRFILILLVVNSPPFSALLRLDLKKKKLMFYSLPGVARPPFFFCKELRAKSLILTGDYKRRAIN